MDALTFHQPGSFGAPGGQIQYVAAVRGHDLVTRAELLCDEPDHPRAGEEYFKLRLGALEKLRNPIKAEKWHCLTFLFSTAEYLSNASTLNDLVVGADERALFWRSLRERAENDRLYKTSLPEMDVAPALLMALLGIKELQTSYETGDDQ